MFEKWLKRLGWSRTEDLVMHEKNADYLASKLTATDIELNVTLDALMDAVDDVTRLRAENAGHVRVIGALMDEVAERV